MKWQDEKVLKSKILANNPVPEHPALKVLKLDEDMLDLLPGKIHEQVKKADEGLSRMITKLMHSLGPLGALWSHLERARRDVEGEIDIDECLSLMEQSVLLLGQANVLGNYYRRTQMLGRFFRSHKRAASTVKQNGELLAANKKELFGHKFYKALHKKAKGTKQAREIHQGLAPASTFRSKYQPFHQPFQQGPSSGGQQRGGNTRKVVHRPQQSYQQKSYQQHNRRGGRGGKAGGHNKSRYVHFTSKSGISVLSKYCGLQKTIDHSDTKSSTTNVRHVETKSLPRNPVVESMSTIGQPASRRQVKILCGKLEENNARQSGTGQCDRVSNTVVKQAEPEPSSVHTKIFGDREMSNRDRNPRDAKERGNNSSRQSERPVSESLIPSREEGWFISAGFQSEKTECTYTISTFQNGNHSYVDKNTIG